MKGKIMAENNNGWEKPEEKFPETEFEDSFSEFFSEEEEIGISESEKKRRKKKAGPDILAVSEETDQGFVITEVVALDTGSEIVKLGEETEEYDEHEDEQELSEEEENSEEADANAENDEPSEEEEEVTEVDLSAEETEEKGKKVFFPNAKKYIGERRKHKYAATVGAVLIGLAIVGTISLCSALFNLGVSVLDNTRQKEAFEWKVYPLLMLDPAAFEDPKQLDKEVVLKSALWATLLENRTKYNYDENGMLLVPASDLDVAAKRLYGSGVVLEHRTFNEGYDYFYIYDEETNTYSVPIMGQTASYVPKVVDIAKDGNVYTLIVGYVSPTTLWNVSEDGSSESVPDKYLYYELEKVARGEYVIRAVRRIPEDELPEDLEVSDMQSLNQTQYFDYDEIQQEYMEQEMEKNKDSSADTPAEEVPETSEGEENPEGEETSEDEESSDE